MILYLGTAVVAVGFLVLVVVLTAIGSHRRGTSLPLSILAGVAFPGTWIVWYVNDDQPYHRTHPHHSDHT